MTDNPDNSANLPIRDGRVFGRIHRDGDDEVTLPGYLDARPSILRDGDVFSVPADYAAHVFTPGTEVFEVIEPPAEPLLYVSESETIAELLDSLPEDVREDAPASPKAAVAAFVDDYRRTHPEPSGQADNIDPAGIDAGQDTPSDNAGDDDVKGDA